MHHQNTNPNLMTKTLLIVMGMMTMLPLSPLLLVVPSSAFEFEFVSKTPTTACINFRGSPDEPWAYMDDDDITSRSAERFCRTYNPDAVTGVITSDSQCSQPSGSYRYSTKVDCIDKNAPFESCTISGSTTPSRHYTGYYVSTFNNAGIKCLLKTPSWSSSSTISTSAPFLTIEGSYGSQTDRSISVSQTANFVSIRPDMSFDDGTLCLPTTVTEEPGSNLIKALCRTAGIATPSSSAAVSAYGGSTDYHRYASNIQCSNSDTATLWNSGCTNTTHYYDVTVAPSSTSGCYPNRPTVTCPTSFEMRLSDPISSIGGYQVVQLRPQGSTSSSSEFDGVICRDDSSYYAPNFASVMCSQMYGDGADFSATYTSSVSSSVSGLPPARTTYLQNFQCRSNSLSSCTATISSQDYVSTCTSRRALISCKINEGNTLFSLSSTQGGDTTTTTTTTAAPTPMMSVPGTGYLSATAPIAGQTNPAAVCSDGFNRVAAVAACRSIGYTPGPNVGFSVVAATSSTSHAINNVSCPPDANKLTDCKLQYSGVGYKISYAAKQVCSGRVYLDCDLGPPTIQFRAVVTNIGYSTFTAYLQVRLYPNAEWGWVATEPGGLTSQQQTNLLCAQTTFPTTTPSDDVAKTYIKFTNCISNATSYSDCSFEYTNGASGSRSVYCRFPNTYSSPTTAGSSSAGLGVGLGLGIPVMILAIVGGVYMYISAKQKRMQAAAASGGGDNNIEMGSSALLDSSHAAVYNFATTSSLGAGGGVGTQGIGGNDIYGNTTTPANLNFTGGMNWDTTTPTTATTTGASNINTKNNDMYPTSFQAHQSNHHGGGVAYTSDFGGDIYGNGGQI